MTFSLFAQKLKKGLKNQDDVSTNHQMFRLYIKITAGFSFSQIS